ncbi:hypothetical protein [Paenibacillus xylaniclasticus]|uniref:hypothetical protein n=1 Tax=Paenibacillus xylaniclasticus TaxID=588083 RepID=UPI0013DFF6E7|nr:MULTISPECIES: hypothetical protein [Paenibacillus]GFN29868.1 hypothetical protein PCURB6_01280 [Paenibacillus curdlanolyticus]
METMLTNPVITLDIRDILSQLGIEESKWHDFNEQSKQKEKQPEEEEASSLEDDNN